MRQVPYVGVGLSLSPSWCAVWRSAEGQGLRGLEADHPGQTHAHIRTKGLHAWHVHLGVVPCGGYAWCGVGTGAMLAVAWVEERGACLGYGTAAYRSQMPACAFRRPCGWICVLAVLTLCVGAKGGSPGSLPCCWGRRVTPLAHVPYVTAQVRPQAQVLRWWVLVPSPSCLLARPMHLCASRARPHGPVDHAGERSGVAFPARLAPLAFTLPPAARGQALRWVRLAVVATADPRAANSVQLGAWRLYGEAGMSTGAGGAAQVRAKGRE